ncbi:MULTISPECIES: hypothetical protein [Pedobacter]|uniref:hypothetical protein n=1 Tax=Pedobacter TaxID=84567 RepID=UPI001E395EF8|nr:MULTISPECIES: hypothetical protein [Pedobacter]
MGINLPVVVAVIVFVIVLVIFLVIRNHKDKKEYEQELMDEELPTEKGDKKNS